MKAPDAIRNLIEANRSQARFLLAEGRVWMNRKLGAAGRELAAARKQLSESLGHTLVADAVATCGESWAEARTEALKPALAKFRKLQKGLEQLQVEKLNRELELRQVHEAAAAAGFSGRLKDAGAAVRQAKRALEDIEVEIAIAHGSVALAEQAYDQADADFCAKWEAAGSGVWAEALRELDACWRNRNEALARVGGVLTLYPTQSVPVFQDPQREWSEYVAWRDDPRVVDLLGPSGAKDLKVA